MASWVLGGGAAAGCQAEEGQGLDFQGAALPLCGQMQMV